MRGQYRWLPIGLKKWTLFGLLLACHTGQAQNTPWATRYFRNQTVSFKTHEVKPFVVEVNNTGYRDTLYQALSENGEPVYYYRKILQEVCFEGECRLLNAYLYWNITGSYLGLELPPEEFLSKSEHTPFVPSEYAELNKILADSLSPLANFAYEDLIVKDRKPPSGLDAVTGATTTNIAGYVVDGAVYTTHTLWHLVYGPTRQEVMRLTAEVLTPELLGEILQSADMGDRYWALNHISHLQRLPRQLAKQVLALMDDKQYNLSERAISSLQPQQLGDGFLQGEIVKKIDQVGYSLKPQLIVKLGEAPFLTEGVAQQLATYLKQSNGKPLITIFDVLQKQQVSEPKVLSIVSDLLANENRFIANNAYKFLSGIAIKDRVILGKMEAYEARLADGY
ncbi:hypothetical protein [Parapedobacter tibetensis]|uniref:hypothetical protein n=1 Tax=Parapedobacter tibetensis TaxID=2972951 RepID=UPI00214D64F8|nr:hypothetical protein [Parapedobacter tibetensis]